MCGIIGIISSKEVSSRIVNSLKKLEYRGYDSAGIATLVNGNINEVKCEGRVDVKIYQNLILKETLVLVMLDGQHTVSLVKLMLILIHQKKFQ